MSDAVTVVISAAGLGTRLGLNTPKALVEVAGRPLLEWQLRMLADVEEVVVVAGFRAQAVIDLVRGLRPDALICLNHEYASTGTAASLTKGAGAAAEWVVSLDGDLLVDREHLRDFVSNRGACLGLMGASSKTPVYATVDKAGTVTELSQDTATTWEWSGLAKLRREDALGLGRGHVFQGLRKRLPIASRVIRCVEIDEIEDLDTARKWIEEDWGRVDG